MHGFLPQRLRKRANAIAYRCFVLALGLETAEVVGGEVQRMKGALGVGAQAGLDDEDVVLLALEVQLGGEEPVDEEGAALSAQT